jgi:hypothetical protein
MRRERNRPARPAEQGQGPRKRLTLWHGLFFVLGAATMGLAGLGLGQKWPGSRPSALVSSLSPATPTAPWGQLEYTEIELERPDESLVTDGSPVPPIQWIFKDCTETELRRLLSAGDVTPEQCRQLTNAANWKRMDNGWEVLPPYEIVQSLSPAARQRIYSVLRQNPKNQLQSRPFHIAADKFENWVETSGLPEEKRTLLRKVAYPDGDQVCIADFELIESQCSLGERKCFAKNVSRNSALLMKLRVTPESDIEALIRYWGRGGRMKAMKPFLESLHHVPEGAVVSVSYFFPEFARMRLYTYPDPQADPTALRQDCFWTAMNFLNEEPDNRFLKADVIRKVLQTEYVQINTNWAFGDVIVLLEAGQDATHMCVYIADNVVFTKNGVDPLEPWLMMKIPDMLTRYETGKPIQLLGYRKKI